MLKRLTLIIIGLILTMLVSQAEEPKEKEKKDKDNKIEEIVVTATKTKRSLSDLPIETSIVNTEQISRSNAQTVTDLLKYTAGIDASLAENRTGTNPWKTAFRGLSLDGGYGLILVDGQRLKGGGMGEYGYGLNQIPPEMIERVEIVKGPGSALYGSDAMAGVINIITKTPDKRVLSFVQGYGTYDAMTQGITYGDKTGNFGYLLNAQMEKSEAAKYSGEDDYKGEHINSKFGYELGKNSRLNLGINWKQQEWLYADEETWKISPAWETEFADASKLTLKGYWYNWGFDLFSPDSTRRKGDQGYRQAESQYTRVFWDKHQVTSGFEFLQETIDFNLANETINTRSVFLQDEWSALDNLDLVMGARLDTHSEFGSEVNPKISTLWKVLTKTHLRASVGRSFKSPTTRQLYYDAPFKHSTYYIQSNPDLKAEHGIGYSLGVTQGFSENISANLSVFKNDINDMVISYDTGQKYLGKSLQTYKNVAEVYTQGIEAELKAQLIESVTGNFSYTFLDTEDKEVKKELPYRPKQTGGLALNYDNQPYGFNINYGLRYVGSMFKDTNNTVETDDYVVNEVKLTKRISENTKISLEANNINNTDYGDSTVERQGRTYMIKTIIQF